VLVLGIDTSDGVSVALLRDDGAVPARADGADPRRHAETLAPAIAWVLAEAGVRARDLDAVAVGTGPAPFTGLRVGLVTARTLARTLDVPAIGVCSLDALARQAFDVLGDAPAEVLAVADARRHEVFAARYRRAGDAPGEEVERVEGPAVTTAAALRGAVDATLAPEGTTLADAAARGVLAVVGRGAELYAAHLPPTPGGPGAVDAAVLARLAGHRARHGGDTGLAPRYLRRPDVTVPAARKRAS
jgi:tRNA threonylcarbamoyladenosine biosynthesis protein TsaB